MLILLFLSSCTVEFDKNSKDKDFSFVLKATGTDKDSYTKEISKLLEKNISSYSKADIYLIMARLTGKKDYFNQAISNYKTAIGEAKSLEEKAFIYETLASLNYKEKKNLLIASKLWDSAGNDFRAEIYKKLAENKKVEFSLELSQIPRYGINFNKNFSHFLIGNSSIILDKNDIVVSQVDRVTRDWLGYQLEKNPFDTEGLLRIFSERLKYSKEELREDIGWHEGARIEEIKKVGLSHKVAVGTLIKNVDGKWYAPNEKGVFMFEVPIDKVLYPTTRFLRKDLGIIVDTHGINMVVEQAINFGATAVVSDCDHPGKVKAAIYLSEKGIKVACTVDKYLPLAFGYNKTIVGSAPIKIEDGKATIGHQPIMIGKNEYIVVEGVNSTKFSISYYNTSNIYFSEFEKYFPLNITYILIDDFNQAHKVLEKAENVVAMRVFNKDDYMKLKSWLKKDKEHKAILFHTSPYPYGYLILKEFPNQTTFDDINPLAI